MDLVNEQSLQREANQHQIDDLFDTEVIEYIKSKDGIFKYLFLKC